MAKQDQVSGVHTVPGSTTSLEGISNHIGVLDAVDLPIILISQDYRIARVNRAATTVLGLEVSDIGQPLGSYSRWPPGGSR